MSIKQEIQTKIYTKAAVDRIVAQARNQGYDQVMREHNKKKAARMEDERRRKIEFICENGIETGLVQQEWLDAGMREFMESISSSCQVIEFSDGRREDPLSYFTYLLQSIKLFHGDV